MDTTVSLKLPPKSYRRTIEELSVVIPDPALKLKFLKQAINEHQKISAPYKLYPPIAGIAFRKRLINNAENICPGSKKAAKKLIRKGVISTPGIRWLWLYKLRYIVASSILILFVLGLGTALSPLVRNVDFDTSINVSPQRASTANTKTVIRKSIFYSQHSKSGDSPRTIIVKPTNYKNRTEQVSWYYKNPILMALASPEVKNSTSKPFSQEPFLFSRLKSSENHLPVSTIKPKEHQNDLERPLASYKIPILATLTSQQVINPPSRPISQKPFLFSNLKSSENHPPLPAIEPAIRQKEPELILDYFRNPTLAALSYLAPKNVNPTSIFQKTMLSSQPQRKGNHPPVSTNKPAKHQNDQTLALDYFKNPILAALTSRQILNPPSMPISQKTLFSSRPQSRRNHLPVPTQKPAKHPNKSIQVPEYLKSPIWLVEKTANREFYSNRLQIITTYTISNISREYFRFSKNTDYSPANSRITDEISGIVYHASESDMYPFMPEMNRSILNYSKRLIKYLLRKKAYHYFIDRFGRVYRLVREDHAAFHAGKSIWADEEAIYLNLNHAFIGICFEGRDFEEINTRKKKKGRAKNSKSTILKPTGISSFNEAQLRSGKELTDWLRVKYNISQQNCVPHALISVNTRRKLIGFHLDLSRGFPFDRLGLSDKYREPLPSMVEFGFVYDRYFEKVFNGDLWPGIRSSEEILHRRARNSGVSIAKYRKRLHQRFSRYMEWNQKLPEKKDQLSENPKKNR